jgi:hypothetical protein
VVWNRFNSLFFASKGGVIGVDVVDETEAIQTKFCNRAGKRLVQK